MDKATDSPASFRIQEQLDTDGASRLSLSGGLDFAGAEQLMLRLRELGDWRAVRLDLASLESVDEAGLRALASVNDQSQRHGWQLEIAPQVSEEVARLIERARVAQELWPTAETG